MYNVIDEPIMVGATFSSGKIVPRFFVWKRRRYRIVKVTYSWRSKIGSAPIFHFAVTSCGSVYEISYNLTTSNWRLEKIHVE